jgi:hypothetical protein
VGSCAATPLTNPSTTATAQQAVADLVRIAGMVGENGWVAGTGVLAETKRRITEVRR